ncbi:MAG TPA: SRPBCC family protein [Solirubrobacteraceae bacterium]|nr:SRPBCC family protein [Solirubrobacteraceae bacterium]
MRTWTARTITDARPEHVLAALTDPERCRDWSPVDFDLDDHCCHRLRAGTRTRVTGRLAGVRVGFDVEVHRADGRRLALSAHGPVRMDVAYDVGPAGDGAEVRASVSLEPGRGVLGTVLAEATAGLLRAGALENAVDRLSRTAAATH